MDRQISGIGMTTQNSTIQATIQGLVDDKFRGRVASIQIGFLAEHFGSQFAIGLDRLNSHLLLQLRWSSRNAHQNPTISFKIGLINS